jgi:hypothetical protein
MAETGATQPEELDYVPHARLDRVRRVRLLSTLGIEDHAEMGMGGRDSGEFGSSCFRSTS